VSFFVSDVLKERVAEQTLLKDDSTYIEVEDENTNLVVAIQTLDKSFHQFEFISLKKQKSNTILSIEIPLTYKYVHQIIGSEVRINLKNNLNSIFNVHITIDNFELIKQNERSCYLLKIVIDE
jgi:hypothetical protein